MKYYLLEIRDFKTMGKTVSAIMKLFSLQAGEVCLSKYNHFYHRYMCVGVQYGWQRTSLSGVSEPSFLATTLVCVCPIPHK
jgi:hypothetical protein